MTPKKTKLNMEEKRHLQKMLFSDIDDAQSNYESRRRVERNALDERLTSHPSPEIVALFEAATRAASVKAEADEALAKAGYRSHDVNGKPTLDTSYHYHPRELKDFDAATTHATQRFAALKREYTLRLFAGNEEARGLFETLALEVSKLTEEGHSAKVNAGGALRS